MRKIVLLAAALLATASASAQISAFRQGSSAMVEGYSLPRTVITVKVTQEREVIFKGPYARYASQYLGVVGAPMNDKESYRIVNAQVGFYEEPDPRQVFAIDPKSGDPSRAFQWLTTSTQMPDTDITVTGDVDFAVPFKDVNASSYTSIANKSGDQLAAEAADIIFKLRKKRIELITGDVGEGAYGQGMQAALDEMNRIEAEYMSLFIGKRYTQTITKTICIVPEVGKTRIPAFRFSDTKGIVADTDLSGRPVNLELVAENVAGRQVVTSGKKGAKSVVYRVPQVAAVSLTDGQIVWSTQRVPVYQSGTAVEAQVVF